MRADISNSQDRQRGTEQRQSRGTERKETMIEIVGSYKHNLMTNGGGEIRQRKEVI